MAIARVLGEFSSLLMIGKVAYMADSKTFLEKKLVRSAEGIGTKLSILQKVNNHDTIGIDSVAMCMNDLLVQGATPLFFLNYFAYCALDKSVLPDKILCLYEC